MNFRRRSATASIFSLCARIGYTAGILSATSHAAITTWDGSDEATNTNWSNSLNWLSSTVPIANDSLVFSGSSGLVNTNDFTPSLLLSGLRFGPSAGTFSLGGASINFNGTIFTESGAPQTVEFDVALQGTSTVRANAGGKVTLNGAVSGSVGVTKTGPGELALENAANTFTGPLAIQGGTVYLGAMGNVLSAPALTIGAGEFSVSGDATGPRTVTLGALTLNAGRSAITIAADAAQPATITLSNVASRISGSQVLYRGPALGTVAPGAAGNSNILFSTAPTPVVNQAAGTSDVLVATGSGILGTTQAAILRGSVIATTATGGGSSFATYDATRGVRALSSAEQRAVTNALEYNSSNTGENVRINGGSFSGGVFLGKTTNSLQINNTSGSSFTLTNSGSDLAPINGLLFTGTSAITLTGGTLTYTSAATSDITIYSSNTATVTLSTPVSTGGTGQRSVTIGGPGNFIINSSGINSSGAGGNFFNGPGNVDLRTTSYAPSSQGTFINGGTVKLGSGFAVSSSANSRPIAVANGATFDINNYNFISSATSGLDALNNINGLGGTVTNTGNTTTNLTLSLRGSGGIFGGSVTGKINLILNRQGSTGQLNQTFTGPLSYTGFTGVTSANTTLTTATLIIGSGGSLPVTTDVTLGGVIGGRGIASGSGILTLGDAGGGVVQTIASLASGGTGSLNAVVGGSSLLSTLRIDGSTTTTFGGTIGGPATHENNLALLREGSGSLTLSGQNTYAGGTTIVSGVLDVSGSISGTTRVSSTGTLRGIGTVGILEADAGGKIAPGTSIGTLTAGDVNFNTDGIFEAEFNIASANSVSSDLLNAGNLNIHSTATLSLINLGSNIALAENTVFTLIDYSGSWTGAFAGLPDDSVFELGENAFRISYDGANNADTSVALIAVPEPGVGAILLVGIAALASRRRK
jgi:fibronectin-binding autotransporter adhesin